MKIAASDFDGTICMPHKPIPQENIDAIKKWQAAGHKFGIVTGRCYDALLGTLAQYGDAIKLDYFICNNGAAVFTPDGRNHYRAIMPTQLYHAVMEHPAVASATYLFIETLYTAYLYEAFPGAMKSTGVELPPMQTVNREEALGLKDVLELSIEYSDKATAQQAASDVGTATNGKLVGITNSFYMDILMGGNNKGTGIRHLMEALGWQDATVFTIGDDYNDLDMISGFEGCALPWSQPPVHAAAKHEYKSVADMLLSNL